MLEFLRLAKLFVAFCVGHLKKIQGNILDSTFVTGFCNWKDATRCFNRHEGTTAHKAAADFTIKIPAGTSDLGNMLSKAHAQQTASNRHYLIKVAESIKFLSRQGIALRGDGTESDSNFMQLLHLRALDDPEILTMLSKKTDKYTSPQIQNELIKIMSVQILRKIAESIQQARYFALMADEVTDTSNKEQFVICFRWVDDDFEVNEDLIGLHHVASITSDVLVGCLKDTILRMNLSISNCRAQCYDGAANMRGSRNGTCTKICAEEPRAIFIHCYGHALNLAAGDTIKGNKILRDTLDTTSEISKLLKFSPRRGAIFDKIKGEISPEGAGFRTLCPTRWTVKAASLGSVISNYEVIQAVWDEALDVARDSETRARLIGVQHCMSTFEYFFGVMLGEMILKHTDNLSKTLQDPKLSASEGQQLADLTRKTLEKLRTEGSFDLFWSKVTSKQQTLEVSDPVLPRRRKTPARFAVGTEAGHHPASPKELFRQQYFECLDLIIVFIKDRFDQPSIHTLKNLENLLLKSARNEDYSEELEYVLSFYHDDFSGASLASHLQLLGTAMEDIENHPSIQDIVIYLKSLSPSQRSIMSEVCTLVKLLLVCPATNAVSERSASGLRRVKTYLRSTMTQQRLNNLMILHVHKHMTDNIDLKLCLNEFVAGSEHRSNLFGQF